MAKYCSARCQSSHWASSHKVECQEIKERRKLVNARDKAEGRPHTNQQLIKDWFMQTPGLAREVELHAWQHRNDKELHFIHVQTFKQTSASGASAGTPQLTAVARSQWK